MTGVFIFSYDCTLLFINDKDSNSFLYVQNFYKEKCTECTFMGQQHKVDQPFSSNGNSVIGTVGEIKRKFQVGH